MDDLKKYSNEEIVDMIKAGTVTNRELTDSGICPTCFNRNNNEILYGSVEDKLIYKDADIECFLVGNPRSNGHTAISSIKHYKDMMEIDDELCNKIFLFSKDMMNILRDVYKCESVYLCTMCDGPMNHFHVQLIPRYKDEKRGSKNFVKERKKYVEDKDKIIELRKRINER